MTLSNPDLYPIDWPQLATEIKGANRYVCQMCGVSCRQEPSDRSKPVLTIAHIDQDYEAAAVFVAALCVRCHLVHDAPLGWVARRRHMRWRRFRAGQLEIFAPRLSAADLRDLEAAWPSSDYLLTLPDGVDYWADAYPVTGFDALAAETSQSTTRKGGQTSKGGPL